MHILLHVCEYIHMHEYIYIYIFIFICIYIYNILIYIYNIYIYISLKTLDPLEPHLLFAQEFFKAPIVNFVAGSLGRRWGGSETQAKVRPAAALKNCCGESNFPKKNRGKR